MKSLSRFIRDIFLFSFEVILIHICLGIYLYALEFSSFLVKLQNWLEKSSVCNSVSAIVSLFTFHSETYKVSTSQISHAATSLYIYISRF